MILDLLRLVIFVLGGSLYIASEFGDTIIKRYDSYPGVYMTRDAKYKVVDDSK